MCSELNHHETNHSEEYYYEIRNKDRDKSKFNKMADYKRAARTIYLNKACFNGLIELIVKMNLSVTKEVHEKYTPKKYDTPTQIGIKWQMDVKYVPKICYVGTDGQKFYQYTVIDEASRERFIYPYKEQSSYSTLDFLKRSIVYFGINLKYYKLIMVKNLLILAILKEFIH